MIKDNISRKRVVYSIVGSVQQRAERVLYSNVFEGDAAAFDLSLNPQ